MIPLPTQIRSYGQYERGSRIHEIVEKCMEQYKDLDVVVMNEVTLKDVYDIIIKSMKRIGFKYVTNLIRDMLAGNGGVIVCSKYPIVDTDYALYGKKCGGLDCMIAKCVLYTRIKKEGRYFNIFSTHMQSWPGLKAETIRREQIYYMSKYIKSFNIPYNEPIIVVGDLNTDYYMDNAELKHMLHTLKMNLPITHEDSTNFTYDPITNELVGSDCPGCYHTEEYPDGCKQDYFDTRQCKCCPSEWLDYLLYSKIHIKPFQSHMKAIAAKSKPFEMDFHSQGIETMTDVSDHYPVIGEFEYNLPDVEVAQMDKMTKNKIMDTNSYTELNLGIFALILFLMYIMYVILTFGISLLAKQTRSDQHPRKKMRYVNINL